MSVSDGPTPRVPGEDPAPREKTGLPRFLELLGPACGPLLLLNVLFLASCIPLVTIPPALFAMNRVVRRMVKDQTSQWLQHYWSSFRRDWKRAYGAFLLTALPMGCAGYGSWFYLGYAAENALFYLPLAFCVTVFLTAMQSSGYLYALLGEGRDWREAVRLALALGLGRPGRALLAALFGLGPLVLAVLLFPLSLLYLLMIGFSLPCMVEHFFLRTVLEKYGK